MSLGRNGGDDETRTRDLCRDRVAFRWNLVIWNGTDNPPAESQRIDRRSFLDPDRTRIRDFPCMHESDRSNVLKPLYELPSRKTGNEGSRQIDKCFLALLLTK